MLTWPALLLLVSGVAGVALGLASVTQDNILLLSLTVLAWLAFRWALFTLQIAWSVPKLVLERHFDGNTSDRTLLWTGQVVHVQIRLTSRHWLGMPYLQVADRVPTNVMLVNPPGAGDELSARAALRRTRTEGSMTADGLQITYSIRCQQAGRLRFDGVQIRLLDPYGLFRHELFLRIPQERLVLPKLHTGKGWPATVKPLNLLPTHGEHRYRQPGSGSELLDIRDYLPGDPPKTIAWKLSARRDRLMTKQYESEVPVRCTLFLDTTEGMHVGGPFGPSPSPLHQSIDLAAGVIQQLTSNRDPVGLIAFDEGGARMTAPATGMRALVRLYAELGKEAGRPRRPVGCPVDDVLPPLAELCREVYPDLLDPSINRPRSWWSNFRRGMSHWLTPVWETLVYLVAGTLLLAFFGITGPLELLVDLLRGPYLAFQLWIIDGINNWLTQFGRQPGRALGSLFLSGGALVFAILTVLLMARWLRSDSSIEERKARKQRKRLGAVLAAKYDLGAAGVALLERDDATFVHWAQRLLAEHDVPVSLSPYDQHGDYQYASAGKYSVLRNHLLRAVSKARDNELFVIFAELLEDPDHWDEVMPAIKVAIARRHRAIIVTPWPAGLPAPSQDEWPDDDLAGVDPLQRRFEHPSYAIRQLDLLRFRRSYQDLRERLGKMGVPVVLTTAADPLRLILDKVRQMRAGATGTRLHAPAMEATS